MASFFTHLALPSLLSTLFKEQKWKILILSVLVSVFPDLDVISLNYFDYSSPWGHRGVTHSFLFGSLLSTFITFLFFYSVSTREKVVMFFWFFAMHTSHCILDAMTNGGLGVGFFIPFDNGRYFLPIRPIPVSPLGVKSFFSQYGLKILLFEFLLILLPVQLIIWAKKRNFSKVFFLFSTIFVISQVLLIYITPNGTPYNFQTTKKIMRTISFNEGKDSISSLLMKKELTPIYNYKILKDLGYFGKEHFLQNFDGWGAGFYPNWYGGIAGRWMDGSTVLFLRTLFGFGVLTPKNTLELLSGDQTIKSDLYSLSPSEKYDIAMGDYSFTTTKSVLNKTHNSSNSKDYYGICNGVAYASNKHDEPFRPVRFINPDGHQVVFHPYDVKALLSIAYYHVDDWKSINSPCFENSYCELNPATLALSLFNTIGRSQLPLVIDLHPGWRAQFYPLVGGKVSVLSQPRRISKVEDFVFTDKKVKYLVPVKIDLTMNSTIMKNNEHQFYPDKNFRFQKAGVVPVKRSYNATLGLDSNKNIIGGVWTSRGFNPDFLNYSISNKPIVYNNFLKEIPTMSWSIIEKIYQKSISSEKGLPTLKLENKDFPTHVKNQGGKCTIYSSGWKIIKQITTSNNILDDSIPAKCFSL